MKPAFEDCFAEMPAIAILRGMQPEEALAVGEALLSAGLRIMEVPLNSPRPLESIQLLADKFGKQAVIGGGTVLSVQEAQQVAGAGGRLVVAPNVNPEVIRFCVEQGLVPVPGWATATEALAAWEAGARYLKLFPAQTYGEAHLKAVKAILPPEAKALAVGGVGAGNLAGWFKAGAAGLGVGSELYKPGATADEVFARASELVAAVRSLA